MKRKKSIAYLTAVLCAIFALNGSITTFAAAEAVTSAEPEYVVKFGDTLSQTSEEYLSTLKTMQQSRATESTQVGILCELFLVTGRASSRSLNYSPLSLPTIRNEQAVDPTVAYRISEYDYRRALFEANGWEITSDNIAFTQPEVAISGDTATATIVEEYTYIATNGFDKECCRIREYTFSLSKSPDGWAVDRITSNDDIEQSSTFTYTPIDVEAAVTAATTTTPGAAGSLVSKKITQQARAMSHYGVSLDSATAYAEKYYNKTNSLFQAEPKNCQNFASQCIWAGLVGAGWDTKTNRTVRPAVSTGLVGTDSPTVWCRGQVTTYYSNYKQNWGWDNVQGFAALLNHNDGTYDEGPFGEIYSGYRNVDAGDILWWTDASSSATATNISHAMFVTNINDTWPLTASDIFVAANTSASNSAYEPLSTYAKGFTESQFLSGKVYGGNYAAPF